MSLQWEVWPDHTKIWTGPESFADGLTEPASLHPIIDEERCIGCGACVAACPEAPAHTVLGIIEGKARLVSPTSCIGHGAIKLVFGSDGWLRFLGQISFRDKWICQLG